MDVLKSHIVRYKVCENANLIEPPHGNGPTKTEVLLVLGIGGVPEGTSSGRSLGLAEVVEAPMSLAEVVSVAPG